jgi:hypothetical protein
MRVCRAALPTPVRAGQKVGVGLPRWALADRAVDVPIELGKLGLQEIGLQEIGMP